jgi:hypothetical protein
LVASGKDGIFSTGEFVSWGDVADRRVKAHGVIVFDEAADQATGVLGTPGRMQPALSDLRQRSIFPLLCG